MIQYNTCSEKIIESKPKLKKKRPRIKKPPREWDFYATNEIYQVGEKDSLGDCPTYTQLPSVNNWVDAKKFRPEKFDLVALDYGDEILTGWWDGNRWTGFRITSQQNPLLWSRKNHD